MFLEHISQKSYLSTLKISTIHEATTYFTVLQMLKAELFSNKKNADFRLFWSKSLSLPEINFLYMKWSSHNHILTLLAGVLGAAQGHSHPHCGRLHVHLRPEVHGTPPPRQWGVDPPDQVGAEEGRWHVRVPDIHTAGPQLLRWSYRRRWVKVVSFIEVLVVRWKYCWKEGLPNNHEVIDNPFFSWYQQALSKHFKA